MMDDQKREKQEHPSFGLITISKTSAGPPGQKLFDSPFRHHHYVSIEISRASKRRTDLHDDFISEEESLIKIALSEAQFATMITTPNMAVGTPCTIGRFGGKIVEDPPADATRRTFAKEANEEFEDLAKDAEALVEMMEVRNPKAADRKAMRDLAGKLSRALTGNLEFFQTRFHEVMEKTVTAAKAEIQAHVADVVQKAGIKALKDGAAPLNLE